MADRSHLQVSRGMPFRQGLDVGVVSKVAVT